MVCWLLLVTVCGAEPGRAVDDLFANWRNGPGGAVGVVQNDRLVLRRGYGYADVAHKSAIDGATNFDLASVSKQFCATAVLLLAQQGRLKTSDRLDRWLPGLPAYAAPVRLHHLLSMTSGLPDYDDSEPTDLAALVQNLRDEQKLTFAPGKRYEYVNLNYALLTFVVEKAGGQPFGRFLQQRIFGPLKMNHTTFLAVRGQPIKNRALGYRRTPRGWVVSRNDVPGVCDGNVFSNVDDLSLWLRDWLRGSSLLQAGWQQQAWTEKLAGSGYGYGFEVDEHAGWLRISHTGSWNGTSTYLAMYPQKKLAVVVLSNREEEDVYWLGEQVEDLYLR